MEIKSTGSQQRRDVADQLDPAKKKVKAGKAESKNVFVRIWGMLPFVGNTQQRTEVPVVPEKDEVLKEIYDREMGILIAMDELFVDDVGAMEELMAFLILMNRGIESELASDIFILEDLNRMIELDTMERAEVLIAYRESGHREDMPNVTVMISAGLFMESNFNELGEILEEMAKNPKNRIEVRGDELSDSVDLSQMNYIRGLDIESIKGDLSTGGMDAMRSLKLGVVTAEATVKVTEQIEQLEVGRIEGVLDLRKASDAIRESFDGEVAEGGRVLR